MTVNPHPQGLAAMYEQFGFWFSHVAAYKIPERRVAILSVFYYCAETALFQTKGVVPALVTEMGDVVGEDAIYNWQLLCIKSLGSLTEALYHQSGPDAESYRLALDVLLAALFREVKASVEIGKTKGFWGNKPVYRDYCLPLVARIESFADIVLDEQRRAK